MKSISAKDIQNFHNDYLNAHNKKIEKQVTKIGIERFSIQRQIIRENPAKFNLQLPSYHLYDQHNSGRCWCFSSLNFIEGNIAKNLNITPRNFSLSANYITFFDKLEKTNYLYNKILESKESLNKLGKTLFSANDPITEGASFINFVNLVKKYGLVPERAMPDTINTRNSRQYLLLLWREKARIDALELYQLRSKLSERKLQQAKKQKLSEMYAFLAKVSGQPPLSFNFNYTDRNKHQRVLKNYTPIQFRDEFLTLDLDDFRLVRCNPLHKYYTQQNDEKGYSDNPFSPDIPYLNLPKEDMKRLAILQIREGLPVKIGTRIDIFKPKGINILDARLLDYSKLGVKMADFETGTITKLIKSQHAMVITGAQIENERVLRWKVENSHKDHQFFVMNDNFFDAYLTNISVHTDILRKAGINF